jgi:hypothetical protein
MADVQEQFTKLAECNVSFVSFFWFRFIPQTSPPVTRRLSFLLSFFPLVATYGSQRPRSTVITCGFGNHPLLLCTHSTLAYRNASAPFVAGKRTFSSLVSKVKAKVQEFENTRYAKIFTLFFSSTLFPWQHMALQPASCLRGPRWPATFPLFSHIHIICSLLCLHLTGMPPTPLPLVLALAQAQTLVTLITLVTLLSSPLRLC